MHNYFVDTETCGLTGPVLLIQWAEDDGPINLHKVWIRPIKETITLIEQLCTGCVIGFNLVYDWFHLNKLYNTLVKLKDIIGDDAKPIDHADEFARCEKQSRGMTSVCLKPESALDLMLYARSGKYQISMKRKPIRIRRVPAFLAEELASEVQSRLKSLDVGRLLRVDVNVRACSNGLKTDPNGIPLADIEIRFLTSGSLKSLAASVLCCEGGVLEGKDVLVLGDFQVPKAYMPKEDGYNPVASKRGWPLVISYHIDMWYTNETALQYASDDVLYTRELYKAFGQPEHGDPDSILSCMVGAVRWRGFKVNLDLMKAELAKCEAIIEKSPCNVNATRQVKKYLGEVLDELEKDIISHSVKKPILQLIASWDDHPAAARAKEILKVKVASYEAALLRKFIKAKRFHASLKVIGTLSTRMSGGDGLNAQGIPHKQNIRECFPLSDEDMILCGGDFDAFEVGLGDAIFDDPALRQILQSGRKIHGLYGSWLYGKTEQEIIASSGTSEDLYFTAKSAFFATILYAGNTYTLKQKFNIDEEVSKDAMERMFTMCPNIRRHLQDVTERFTSLSQSGGLGSKIDYQTPDDYAETKLGFRRYFTIENAIIKILYDLAQNMPKKIKELAGKVRIVRNAAQAREQSADAACMTALYGAAFGIQGGIIRAATNHYIQSLGATITKALQVEIWKLQPTGIQPWVVCPLNVHDEVMCPTLPSATSEVKTVVEAFIESMRQIVPCINMKWKVGLQSWATKK